MAPTTLEEYNEFAPPANSSKLDRVKSLTYKVKSVTKKLVNEGTEHDIVNHDDNDDDEDDDDVFENPAFSPQKILAPGPDRMGSIRNRLQQGAHAAVEAVKHPRRAVADNYTRKFAANISKQHHDYASDLDTALVDAHDALESAEATAIADLRPGQDADHVQNRVREIDNAQRRIEDLDKQRQDLRTAWIIGRHVKRVKVIRPMSRKPVRSQFVAIQGSEDTVLSQWASYLGHLMLWYTRQFTAQHIDDFENPPFDLTELAGIAERLTITSTPMQSFIMDVRNIYTWRDPGRTMGCMLLFWALWYVQQIVSFVLASIIYATISNKIHPANVQTIRRKIQRIEDQKSKAQAWTELIQKHGKQNWVEPLLDNIGPVMQLQLEDLTSFLEVSQNFYHWESPRKTMATLFLMIMCLLFVLLTDIGTCVRLLWATVGSIFFYSFPIATNYPKYRHIVNPIFWVFWDIPNTAEVAIAQLQEKVVLRDAQKLDRIIKETEKADENFYISPLDNLSDTSSGSDYSSDSDDQSTFEDARLSNSNPSIEPSHLRALQLIQSQEHHTFRAVILPSQVHSRITLLRTGFWIYNKAECQFHPYGTLAEIQKFDLATNTDDNYSSTPRRKIEKFRKMTQRWKTLQIAPSGLAFIFYPEDTIHNQLQPQQKGYVSDSPNIPSTTRRKDNGTQNPRGGSSPPAPQTVMIKPEDRQQKQQQQTPNPSSSNQSDQSSRLQLELMISLVDRDRIFSLVLSWSGIGDKAVKWKPLFSMNRQNKMGHRDGHEGAGNGNLDEAVKKVFDI